MFENIFSRRGIFASRLPSRARLALCLPFVSTTTPACATAPPAAAVNQNGAAWSSHQHVPVREETLPDDGRVSLAEVLAYAERHAPAVVMARGELAVGEAEVEAARQAQPFNPTVSLGLGQRRQAGGVGLEAAVAVEQQLEIAGQRRKRRAVASGVRDLTRLGLDAANWEAHAAAHRAFEKALLAEELLRVADRLVAFDEQLLAIARRRAELGDEPAVAIEVAVAQLAMTQNVNTAARAEVETARLALAQAIGWPGPRKLTPLGTSAAARGIDGRESLVREALARSPALRQADARISVTRARTAAARRDAVPSPTVELSYAREGSTSTPGNPSPASDVWMGTISVPIPVFARNQASVARGRAAVTVAETQQRVLRRQFDTIVASAVTRVDAAAARVHTLEREVLPAFERTLAALQRGFDLGELEFLDVAQSRAKLAEVRQGVLDAKNDYLDAFAELERLVGPLPEGEVTLATVPRQAEADQ